MKISARPIVRLPELRAEDLRNVVGMMGAKAVELILKRTNAGRDAMLQPFHAYSDEYAAARRRTAIYNGQAMSRTKADARHRVKEALARSTGRQVQKPLRLTAGTPRLRVTGKMLGALMVIQVDDRQALVGWIDPELWPIVRGLTITWRGKNKPPGPGRRFFALEHPSDIVQIQRVVSNEIHKLLTRGVA